MLKIYYFCENDIVDFQGCDFQLVDHVIITALDFKIQLPVVYKVSKNSTPIIETKIRSIFLKGVVKI